MSSEEVARATADVHAENAALRTQLVQAQADAETLRAGVLAYFAPVHEISDHRLRVQLIALANTAHPGTPLADEVTAARAAITELHLSYDRRLIETEAQLANARNDRALLRDEAEAAGAIIGEMRMYFAEPGCDCDTCVRRRGPLGNYDAARKVREA